LPDALLLEDDPGRALAGRDCLIVAVTVAGLRPVLRMIRAAQCTAPVIWLCKGFEQPDALLPHEVFAEEMDAGQRCAVLSGPSFAQEVAAGLPTALTLASADQPFAAATAQALHSSSLRVYSHDDIIGVEVGGAVKNVIAIACGIVYGRKLGENARAAIMTRGMAEIKRMGMALGAKPETFLGLSGMGDLMLTCNSLQSRNFSLGVMCGEGQSLNEILTKSRQVIEGVATANSVLDFAKKHAVDMPICQAVNDTLHNGVSVDDTVEALMSRPLTQEI
jgi:glycerol-3-phosphate dehydrogenase (NAD(P)+)